MLRQRALKFWENPVFEIKLATDDAYLREIAEAACIREVRLLRC